MMAEDSPTKRPLEGGEEDSEDGPSDNKKQRVEEPTDTAQEPEASPNSDDGSANEDKENQEPRDPGKKQYREINKCLRHLKLHASKTSEERTEDLMGKMRSWVEKVKVACTGAVDEGEIPNPMKIIQMHLKHVLFNSEKVKDGDNIKNFLSGLEDGSASTSDKDSSVFVFLANFATELWYSWNDQEAQWQWTPEKWTEQRKWWLWMPCSTTVVTDGQWKNETPAPENVEIIKYLDAVRPVPSDEQYLPEIFDIADLFKKLVGMKDDEVTASVKVILEKIVGEEVQSKSSHVTAFLEEVTKLLQEVSNDTAPQ